MAKTQMNDLTIIYYTDNALEPWFEARVQRELLRAVEGKRIISVSQKPLDFGDNICIGEIGRSIRSMYYQILVGAREARTKYIALAEHDCMYVPDHFNWRPKDDGVFWYNTHSWFAHLNSPDGQYTYRRRRPMSMLICALDIFIPAMEQDMVMIDHGFTVNGVYPGICEPGVIEQRQSYREAKAAWLKRMREEKIILDAGKRENRARAFKTRIPNLDIRHSQNFSPRTHGAVKCYELPYWGRLKELMANG